MKELIKILETAQSKHGGTSPLTIGHLLNICKLAEKVKNQNAENKEIYKERILDEVLIEARYQ
jgi:predicted Zn-dependent protease